MNVCARPSQKDNVLYIYTNLSVLVRANAEEHQVAEEDGRAEELFKVEELSYECLW